MGIAPRYPPTILTLAVQTLSDAIPNGTRYYWVTVDLEEGAGGTIKGTIGNAGALSLSYGTLSGSSSYGDLNADSEVPLPVTLSLFSAVQENRAVTLTWVTESEVDNLGFHVYRALSQGGEYERLTSEVIEGRGTATGRHRYLFTDVRLTNGLTYWYTLQDVALDGTTTMHGPIAVTPQAPQAQAEVSLKPDSYSLSQNVPNPFNPFTIIAYKLPEAAEVMLIIYTITGQRVATLVSGRQEAGHYQVSWDGSGFACGIYLYRLEAGSFTETRKALLLR